VLAGTSIFCNVIQQVIIIIIIIIIINYKVLLERKPLCEWTVAGIFYISVMNFV